MWSFSGTSISPNHVILEKKRGVNSVNLNEMYILEQVFDKKKKSIDAG